MVVCQGGNGTIYQALAAGVPIVGVPTMHDQDMNLQRVVALGAGIQLSGLRFKPRHLAEAVTTILSDDRYRTAAQAQARILADFDGPTRGAEILDRFLRERPAAAR